MTFHPVAQKRANELGIYDMSGNVMEWCSDWFGDYPSSAQTNPTGPSSGKYKVVRGGYFRHKQQHCYSTFRLSGVKPDIPLSEMQFTGMAFGLRLAMVKK